MSYDFRLFLPQPGVDPLVTAQAGPAEKTEEINPGPPVPVKEQRKQSIAARLMKANSALQLFQFDFDRIANLQRISVEEAKLRFRHLELNGPQGGNGIQIMLFDDEASVTVAFWHKDKKAKAVFLEIWGHLSLIQYAAGYQIYDPQLERLIDLRSDLEDVMKCYTDVVKRMG